MTTKTTIALAELTIKGADADLLQGMIQFVAQRMIDMDAESLCAAAYGKSRATQQPQRLPRKAGRDPRRIGGPEASQAAKAATFRRSWNRVVSPRRR